MISGSLAISLMEFLNLLYLELCSASSLWLNTIAPLEEKPIMWRNDLCCCLDWKPGEHVKTFLEGLSAQVARSGNATLIVYLFSTYQHFHQKKPRSISVSNPSLSLGISFVWCSALQCCIFLTHTIIRAKLAIPSHVPRRNTKDMVGGWHIWLESPSLTTHS